MQEKYIDETRQGEVMELPTNFGDEQKRKLYIESYGCAMNFSDTEIVASIMSGNNFTTTRNVEEADVVFLNTCAIRDNAEQRVWGRLRELKLVKKNNPD